MPDPNDFTEDADQTGDDVAPVSPSRVVAPPPVTAQVAPPAMAMPPGRPVVAAPGINPQWSGADRLQRARDLEGIPVDQAQQAVNSAIRFQAQRGYQNDLQGGMAPAEALAKWAPMLFGSTAGAAAATSRAAIAARPERKIVRGPGGQLFVDPGSGQLQPVSPAPGPKVIQPPAAVKEIIGNQAAIKRLEGVNDENVATAPFTPEGDVLRNRNFALRQGLPGATPSPPPSPPPAAPALGSTAVPQKVSTKAEFDALPSGTIYIGKNGKRYRKP